MSYRRRIDRRPRFDALESRLSLSTLLLAAADDPLPAPEPAPGTDPGTATPIIIPPLPPSGPIAPGTS